MEEQRRASFSVLGRLLVLLGVLKLIQGVLITANNLFGFALLPESMQIGARVAANAYVSNGISIAFFAAVVYLYALACKRARRAGESRTLIHLWCLALLISQPVFSVIQRLVAQMMLRGAWQYIHIAQIGTAVLMPALLVISACVTKKYALLADAALYIVLSVLLSLMPMTSQVVIGEGITMDISYAVQLRLFALPALAMFFAGKLLGAKPQAENPYQA